MSEAAQRRRIGILGGSFDPIHLGHLMMAEAAREQFALEEVRFIPAALAPHKVDRQAAATGKQRAEMVKLAIGGNAALVCDERELNRGGISYTVETLEELQREFPTSRLVLIIGGDSLRELHTWRDPVRICQLAFVAVVARGGEPVPDLHQLQKFLPSQEHRRLEEYLLLMPQLEISSTDIRRRIAAGRSVRYMLPPAVKAYIAAQQLYEPPSAAGAATDS